MCIYNLIACRPYMCLCAYLFEVDHDIFGQLHVFEHSLKFTGEGCTAFCRGTKNTTNIRLVSSNKRYTSFTLYSLREVACMLTCKTQLLNWLEKVTEKFVLISSVR